MGDARTELVMNDDAALWTDREFALRLEPVSRETLLVALSGELGIAHVEEVAACADQVCGLPVRTVRLELSGLAAVDEPGARTLAVACQCLRRSGHRVEVRGVGPAVRRVLDRLGLALDAGDAGRRPDPTGATASTS
jgi:anti-anti-sigma regulatory factor